MEIPTMAAVLDAVNRKLGMSNLGFAGVLKGVNLTSRSTQRFAAPSGTVLNSRYTQL